MNQELRYRKFVLNCFVILVSLVTQFFYAPFIFAGSGIDGAVCSSDADCAPEFICRRELEEGRVSVHVCRSRVPIVPPEEKKIEWKPVQPTLQIKIPTLPKFSELPPKADTEGNIYIPFLGEYLAAIYRYAVSIVGIVAAVFIIYGGFQYITSGGAADKVTRAKETIGNALIALFLVLGSYVVFYTIDPELVQFKYLKIKVIQNVPIPDTDPGTDLVDVDEFVPEGGLKEIQSDKINTKTLDGTAARLNSRATEALVKAAEDLYGFTGEKIRINSGYRSWQEQSEKYQKNCSTLPCSPPTCKPRLKNDKPIANCPHTSAQAIDVVCNGKNSSDPCQEKLKQAMLSNGFCQLSTEAWHFELPKLSPNCRSY